MKKSFLESLDRPVLEIHPVSNGNGERHPACDWATCSALLTKVENELARIRFLLERSAPSRSPEIGVAAAKAVQLCSIYFHVPIKTIRSRFRQDRVALARHVAFRLTELVTGASLHQLGDAFGLHHTTVHHGLQNVRNRCLDADTKAAVELLEARMTAIFGALS